MTTKPSIDKAIPQPSHFSFDVWQCTNCGLIVTDLQYKMAAFNYECNCGQLLSTFRFVPARRLAALEETKST